MTSSITPITTASSNGAEQSTAGTQKPREHGMTVLRDREAKALISLGMDALSEAYTWATSCTARSTTTRPASATRVAADAGRGADLHGAGRALPAHARQHLRGAGPAPRRGRAPVVAPVTDAGPGERQFPGPASHTNTIPVELRKR